MHEVLPAGFVVFAAVATAVIVCNLRPGWRRHTPTATPLVLGAAAAAAAVVLLSGRRPGEWMPQLFGGVVGVAWVLPIGAATVTLGLFAFHAERVLVRRPRRRSAALGALPPQLLAADLPARAESMAGVAETAQHPGRFWAISGVTVLGEELFFRVAARVSILTAGGHPLLAIGVPALMYAVMHIGFGMASVAGKTLLCIVLGAGAWAGGALFTAAPASLSSTLCMRVPECFS
ncbi:type II CAAX prenyl endopeptidase Rce1 family protein [Microbacterium sp.]|uniref:CPBP family glutamic-type intramembrane protease n=1 Tax=Microbacterium sp. TaxID=51671 RepID=UPI003A85AC42